MYNNPFLYQSMYKPSLLSKLFGGAGAIRGGITGINWGNMLNTAQKSLGVINQAIPLINQVKPLVNNAKTMFKIANAIKGDNNVKSKDAINNNNNYDYNINESSSTNENKPIFYI